MTHVQYGINVTVPPTIEKIERENSRLRASHAALHMVAKEALSFIGDVDDAHLMAWVYRKWKATIAAAEELAK